jgi:activating signal cointegrator 1
MRALSLRQPWASLIAIGAKKVETRSWSTRYRGPIAIQASRRFTDSDLAACGGIAPGAKIEVNREPGAFARVLGAAGYRQASDFPTGKIVAIIELLEVRRIEPSWLEELSVQERAFGDYSTGRYAWMLGPVRRLPHPVAARGHLGLWRWNPPEDAAVWEAQSMDFDGRRRPQDNEPGARWSVLEP